MTDTWVTWTDAPASFVDEPLSHALLRPCIIQRSQPPFCSCGTSSILLIQLINIRFHFTFTQLINIYFTPISWLFVLLHNRYPLQPCSPQRVGETADYWWCTQYRSVHNPKPQSLSDLLTTAVNFTVEESAEYCWCTQYRSVHNPNLQWTIKNNLAIYRINFWPQDCCIL